MLMSGRIIPATGKPPSPWSFASALELPWHLWVHHSLQIEDQSLVEVNLTVTLDPFDFNWFMLCPWAMSFFQKLCPAPVPPVSCSFHEPHLGPQCCLYNLQEGQPENSWPLGEKCYIIPISLDIQAFIFHISYNMCNISISQ